MKKTVLISTAFLYIAAAGCSPKNPLEPYIPKIDGYQTAQKAGCIVPPGKPVPAECPGTLGRSDHANARLQLTYLPDSKCGSQSSACSEKVRLSLTAFHSPQNAYSWYTRHRNRPWTVLENSPEDTSGSVYTQTENEQPVAVDVIIYKGDLVITASADDAAALSTARQLAVKTASAYPKSSPLPALASVFPPMRLQVDSLIYFAGAHPLSAHLNNTFQASYTSPDKKEYSLIISRQENEGSAASVFETFKKEATAEPDFKEEFFFQKKGFSYSAVDGLVVILAHGKDLVGAFGPGISQSAQAAAELSLLLSRLKP